VQTPQQVTIEPARRVRGTLSVPGDKSVSHRYALLAAIADGPSIIANYAPGADCASTLACLHALGVDIRRSAADRAGDPPLVHIIGRGLRGLQPAAQDLDCGNSGSTMRMIAGVLAAHAFETTLVGDQSLTRRPMRRVMEPLARMGARIDAAAGDRPPLVIHGADLHGIEFAPAVPSAQVKSAVLLAGLQASGQSHVIERTPTRDHTERALAAFSATLERTATRVSIAGGQRLHGVVARVPGDISSAAFPAAAAAALGGSDVTIEGVGLNPTRTAFLDVLRRFGAQIDVEQTEVWQQEPVGRIRVRATGLGELELGPDEVPGLIDELPVLGALAASGGELRVTGAAELRVKESDRIAALVAGLRAIGAEAEELPDGFHIRSRRPPTGGRVHAQHDHRLAMAFAVAALASTGPVTIDGAEAVGISYPAFFDDLQRLRT
jgi:3-phosphoshikimate 1-carboxyvinyltransferase